MHVVNQLGTPAAAYAAAPHQAAFAPPAAVDLPPAHEIPDRGDDASGEPPPDLLGHPREETSGDEPAAEDSCGSAGAAYGADGRITAAGSATAQVSLLAY